jgi:tryptophan-rich sensory protein
MVFNLLWSPVFFILHKIDIAFFIILIMDITAFVFVKKFFAISKAAGFILIPYLAWILFATYLNLQFLRLN